MSAPRAAGRTRDLRTLALFVVNGVFATGLHYCSLALLIEEFRLTSAGLANGLAAIVGISASYLGNRVMVFRSDASARATLPRFLMLYVGLALFHTGCLALWSDGLGLPYGWGFILATGLGTAMSYLGNRYFVFTGSTTAGSQA